jgi:hypothetical protein
VAERHSCPPQPTSDAEAYPPEPLPSSRQVFDYDVVSRNRAALTTVIWNVGDRKPNSAEALSTGGGAPGVCEDSGVSWGRMMEIDDAPPVCFPIILELTFHDADPWEYNRCLEQVQETLTHAPNVTCKKVLVRHAANLGPKDDYEHWGGHESCDSNWPGNATGVGRPSYNRARVCFAGTPGAGRR